MLIRKEYIDDNVILGIRRIDTNRDLLINMLPESQRKGAMSQVSKIKAISRVVEWLNTRVLLFELLGEEKIISKHPDGRPFLIDKSYKISISHTKDYVVILLSASHNVGIDIEMISDRVTRLYDKFISDNEYINSDNEVVHQLLHWSAKETLFKIMKESEVDFKEHLRILPFDPLEKGVFKAKEFKTIKQKEYCIHYEVFEDAVLTWTIDN